MQRDHGPGPGQRPPHGPVFFWEDPTGFWYPLADGTIGCLAASCVEVDARQKPVRSFYCIFDTFLDGG